MAWPYTAKNRQAAASWQQACYCTWQSSSQYQDAFAPLAPAWWQQVCSKLLIGLILVCHVKPVDFIKLYQFCQNQTWTNLIFAGLMPVLKQCVLSLWVIHNQLASSLLKTCNRVFIIKPEQLMQTHPDIGLITATYTAKNTTDLLQGCNFTSLWELVQQVCEFHQAATYYNLLKQLVAHNKFWQSTCNKSVDNFQQTRRQKAVTSHANTSSWYWLVVTSFCKMSTDLLQLAFFWLCKSVDINDMA